MDPRIPTMLHPLFQSYTRCVEQEMPGRVTAFYLEGSIALGGFNPRLSDIDFIALLDSPATSIDFEKLLDLHTRLADQHPAWKVSGRYLQPGDLGCREETAQPFLNYHDGRLQWTDQFGLSAVTWWILKNHGIAVFGPPAHSLDLAVDIEYLIRTQRENLKAYWAGWTRRPDGLLALLTDWGIEWTVLGVLRQFYTFRERAITSKVKAGEYALTCLPEHWHRIIREAIALRENPKRSGYSSRFLRALDAYRFLEYIIPFCAQPSNFL